MFTLVVGVIFAVVALVATLGCYLVRIYNTLIVDTQAIDNAAAQIDVHLRRRLDLVTALSEAARGYLRHESQTLRAVAAARRQGTAAGADPGVDRASAGAAIDNALVRLSMVVEAHPELKGDARVAALMEEVVSTENRLAYVRQNHNDAVTVHNTRRQTFPVCLFASRLGFGENRVMIDVAPAGVDLNERPGVVLEERPPLAMAGV